ncbi:ATP-binding protein [Dyella terrae]|uniref:ATP-binding protein n=1 Tax=Dyella terrae TaxID=522259 RepID=UPI001EFD5A85|nr:ATP-binding protein [Dyella terrae]ULU23184.1 hypothetical protein DYST_00075 [Dyella terrae]
MADQLPIKGWQAFIKAPAIADAIWDQLIHSSLNLTLKGESQRKLRRGHSSTDADSDQAAVAVQTGALAQ